MFEAEEYLENVESDDGRVCILVDGRVWQVVCYVGEMVSAPLRRGCAKVGCCYMTRNKCLQVKMNVILVIWWSKGLQSGLCLEMEVGRGQVIEVAGSWKMMLLQQKSIVMVEVLEMVQVTVVM